MSMFGFGEVRTHLRAVSMMFMDYFWVFEGFPRRNVAEKEEWPGLGFAAA